MSGSESPSAVERKEGAVCILHSFDCNPFPCFPDGPALLPCAMDVLRAEFLKLRCLSRPLLACQASMYGRACAAAVDCQYLQNVKGCLHAASLACTQSRPFIEAAIVNSESRIRSTDVVQVRVSVVVSACIEVVGLSPVLIKEPHNVCFLSMQILLA